MSPVPNPGTASVGAQEHCRGLWEKKLRLNFPISEIRGIGVQAPFEVWTALPAGTPAPKCTQVALRVTRPSGAAFSKGIVTVVLDGALFTILAVCG